jgi:hypothetical protein
MKIIHPSVGFVPVDLRNIEPSRPAKHDSVLARILVSTIQPDLAEVDGFEPLAISECFEHPRYTPEFLRRAQLSTHCDADPCKHGLQPAWCSFCKDLPFIVDYLAEDRPKAKRYTIPRKFKLDKPFQPMLLSDKAEATLRSIFDVKPKVTPYDPAWDALRLKTHPSRFGEMPLRGNWCPNCKEYVAMGHDGYQGISCEEYIAKRDEKAKQQAAKAAKTLEEYCAEYKEQQRKRTPKANASPTCLWLKLQRQEALMLFHSDAHDLAIIEERKRTGSPITKVDNKLWNKLRRGNKYRI